MKDNFSLIFIWLLLSVCLIALALTYGRMEAELEKCRCGVEIPGIVNQSFCIGHDDKGTFYENQEYIVRIK